MVPVLSKYESAIGILKETRIGTVFRTTMFWSFSTRAATWRNRLIIHTISFRMFVRETKANIPQAIEETHPATFSLNVSDVKRTKDARELQCESVVRYSKPSARGLMAVFKSNLPYSD